MSEVPITDPQPVATLQQIRDLIDKLPSRADLDAEREMRSRWAAFWSAVDSAECLNPEAWRVAYETHVLQRARPFVIASDFTLTDSGWIDSRGVEFDAHRSKQ